MSRRDDYQRSAPPKIDNMVSLKVDNLPYRTSVDKLKRIFSRYGDIGDIYIPRDPRSYESRGFAFVRYYDERDAEDAIHYLDGKEVDGRDIRVQYAKYGRPSNDKSSRGRRDNRRRRSPRRRSHSRSRSRSYSRSVSRSRSRSRHSDRSLRRSKSRD